MPTSLLVLAVLLMLSHPAKAQLDEPGGSCFEPIKPSCAEVTVNSEDEGWALRCREEQTTFLEGLNEYEQCVIGRIQEMRERASSESDHIDCIIERESGSDEGSTNCERSPQR